MRLTPGIIVAAFCSLALAAPATNAVARSPSEAVEDYVTPLDKKRDEAVQDFGTPIDKRCGEAVEDFATAFPIDKRGEAVEDFVTAFPFDEPGEADEDLGFGLFDK